jgi:hypothetical protein
VLTLSASGTAATGTFNVTITGTSGTLSSKATITLTVNPAGNYTLSASSVSVAQGANGTSTVTVNPLNGFSGNVSLSASGLPNGITAAFNPGSTTTTSTLTLSASNTAALGTFTITVTGVSGALSRSTSVSLTVLPPPNFGLSASPNSLSLGRKGKATSIITITPQNGFAGSVSLSASGLPRGVTASFSPASTASVTTLTLSAKSNASIGTFSVQIAGSSAGLTHTTTISVSVHR